MHLQRSGASAEVYRYCTSYLVEGAALDCAGLEGQLAGLGDSLVVVGDGDACKVHVA